MGLYGLRHENLPGGSVLVFSHGPLPLLYSVLYKYQLSFVVQVNRWRFMLDLQTKS